MCVWKIINFQGIYNDTIITLRGINRGYDVPMQHTPPTRISKVLCKLNTYFHHY